MWSAVIENPHWFWLTIGCILLAAELLGAGGYLLWSGTSALIVGLLTWKLSINWPWQWVNFSLLTILSAALWWYWLQRRNRLNDNPQLNLRNQQLIGVRATLQEPLQNGLGRIRVGDSSWRVEADSNIDAGTEVEVIAVKGITLKIKKS